MVSFSLFMNCLRDCRAAVPLFSPPPCGEGWGSRSKCKNVDECESPPDPPPNPPPQRGRALLEDDAWIADALVAIDEVDLLGLDLPASAVAHDAMPRPAGEHSGLIAPEFADQKIRAHHAGVVARGGKNLDIGDEAHRARRRRLRPGEAGAHAVDPILEPAAVVEHHRNFAPRVAGLR